MGPLIESSLIGLVNWSIPSFTFTQDSIYSTTTQCSSTYDLMMTYYDPAIMRVQPVSELWVARLEKKKKDWCCANLKSPNLIPGEKNSAPAHLTMILSTPCT